MSVATLDRLETIAVPVAEMSVLDAIETRRSVSKMLPDRPPRAVIERVLDAATWAPCHHVTEPWRFVVIAGEARGPFGEVSARSKVARMDPATRDIPAEFERAKNKAFRAPVIIAVGVEPGPGPKIVESEEVAAGAAAVQNMLLAAHALGLGAIWRSGDAVFDPTVKAHLGFSPAAHIVGFVYLGYPAIEASRAKHTPAAELTRWTGWNDEIV